MVLGLFLLLLFQLIGEAVTRGFGLPIPGPVLGFVLLTLLLAASRPAREAVEPTAQALLRHLSLLYVPALTGVVQQWGLLREQGIAIGVALVLSTWAAIAVTALTFRAVSRLTRAGETA